MNDKPQNNSPGPQDDRGNALSSFHQKRVLLPIAILGSLGTVLTWLMPPSRLFSFLPPFLADYASRIFSSLPAFLAVYALGHLLSPQIEKGPDIEAGFMSGYLYREKSAKRWYIIIVAVVIAALNYFLVSFYWEGRN